MLNKPLISKNKRDIITFDYAHNYDSINRKRKWRIVLNIAKWLVLVCMFAMSVLYVGKLQAAHHHEYKTLDDVSAGQLLFESSERLKTHSQEKKLFEPALLIDSSAEFDINGIIATVTLTQSFINQGSHIANGLYTFPLPENSAVNYLKVQVGNKTIEGKILEKKEAKQLFIKAKAQGEKASLVEQHRPNLFTNSIANIAPKEQITVTIKYVQRVEYDKGTFSLRFPMKITPRYPPKPTNYSEKNGSPSAVNTEINKTTAKLTNNQLVTYLSQLASLNTNNIQLNVNLNAGIEIDSISSQSHQITSNKSQQNRYQISVGHVQVPMDRDFVLQWRPKPSNAPQLSVVQQMLDGEFYALAMLLPATHKHALGDNKDNVFSRDVTFIIDTSGSMQGASIKQAKQSLRFALNTLTPADSFNIIAFESSAQSLFNTTKMANKNNIEQALSFISKLSADGGTEMYRPLSQALTMQQSPLQSSTTIKQILFITDGAVSNEHALFQLINSTTELPRLFTVGIGSAPNGYFMRKAAQFGQGSYTYIGNTNEVEEKMSNLLRKISQPKLKNINVRFSPLHTGGIEQYPSKIPDLYDDEPLVVAFKTPIMPTKLQLFGELSDRKWQDSVNLLASESSINNNAESATQNKGITSIWARAKIEDLLDGLVTGKSIEEVKPKVIHTSLKHQVMSPYTSFIAVETETVSVSDLVEQEQGAEEATANDKASLKLNKPSSTLAKQGASKQQLTQKVIVSQSMSAMPFPATAVGWKSTFFAGLILLILSLFTFIVFNNIKKCERYK